MPRVKFPHHLTIRFDQLRATLLIIANLNGMLRRARDARFEKMLKLAITASDEFNHPSGEVALQRNIAL
jgi:hypothetical protein